MTDADVIEAIILREGGQSDDPADHGGITRYGVTKKGLSEMLKRPANDSDILALTDDTARFFYRWLLSSSRADRITNDEVRGTVFDCVVNHGAMAAIQLLQRAVKVDDDGKLGPMTIAAVEKATTADPTGKSLARLVLWQRVRLYGRLVTKNLTDRDRDGIPDNTEMALGWANRTADMGEDLG